MIQAPGKHKRTTRLIAALAGSCLAMVAHAKAVDSTEFALSISQPDAAGHTFDQINFPVEAVPGQIKLQARAGWLWREGQTHRIVLDRDVDVVLGDHRFLAVSANLWLRKIASDPERQGTRYQVYAIFEDLRSADGTITMKAQQLPVRGVIEIADSIVMKLDARFDEPPIAKTRVGRFFEETNVLYAQRVLGAPSPVAESEAIRPWAPDWVPPKPEVSDEQKTASFADARGDPRGPIFHPTGVFSVSIGGRIVIDGASSGGGSVITADGGVVVQYQDAANQQWIDFKAQRMVIYTTGDEPITGVGRLGVGQIEGIYLEGGVFAGDDQWSIRTPRMYLDVKNNKALMLDAVFWTTDQKTGMPLYVRAQSIRQRAQREFAAEKAKISNTAFFEPDLTIGVSDIKVTLHEDEGQDARDTRPHVTVEGKNVTLNVGNVPVLWLPGFKGDPSSFPLKQFTIEDTNRSGTAIKTRWNALSLLNLTAPPGLTIDLQLDYYADRGFGVGVMSDWMTREHRGGLFSYLLFDDNGTDITPSGRRIGRDGQTRGIFALHDIWEFTNAWTLVTELSYVSDEAFVGALFDQRGRTTEDFRNRLQIERLSDDTYFALELSTTANDFIVPEHLLQSPGYQVNKIPEARFVSLGKDLLPDFEPGLLTYAFEARAGMLRLAFSEVAASGYGFDTNSLADDAFGTAANTSLSDVFRAMGLDESMVARVDMRHELSARLDWGPIRVIPFVVGRATAYDSSFDAFSPGQHDEVRFWGSGGVTLSTTISKINNNAQSQFFDIHRLRHIIEPSITLWGSDSNFDANDVPIFDDDVEGLITGTSMRAAIDQTWQTKRGGIGRWRDVDVLKLRTEYVTTSDRAGKSRIPEYFSSRPELSNPGDYFGASAIWQPTEVLAFAGEIIYDLDLDETARASIGAIIEHRPWFTTSVEYREIQALDATFASLRARYRLTDKYALNTGLNYNFDLNDFQVFNAQILRRFQIGTLGTIIRYDNIKGETSFGFIFRPAGSRGDLPIDSSWGG